MRAALSLLVAFLVTAVAMPAVIALSKKLKVRQTILHYVDNHQSKSGTPTMGGIGIMIGITVASLCLMTKNHSLMLLVLFVTLAYGVIGFLDDFIKVFFKQNKGLSPWQKILFQVIVAVIVAFYAYYNDYILDLFFVPFTLGEISLGIFSIPLYIVVFLAVTNSVNLTDGLDGLASKVTAAYTVCFAVIIALIVRFFGDGQAFAAEYENILIFCAALIGALIGFICYNGFPAKIFMGDTGALALGGAIACLAVVTKTSLMVPVLGIMYVLTSLSDIIQVLYYKKTKKRIFLMAPLHHHFERKGVHENRIVTVYTSITAMVGVLSIIIILAVNA